MGAAAVRAGSAFVEIGADPRKLFAALNKINKQIGSLGSSMSAAGRKVMGAGLAVAAPFGAAVAAGSRFQDVMLAVRASTGATADQVQAVRQAALAMSQALGVGPTEAASGFLELLKAGMSVEQVLNGAGEAAIAFAKVGNMAVGDAAVVMADAMNVFGVKASVAADAISAAADSSSTDIHNLAIAFSQVAAVAGLANQNIHDTAAALAVMANAGVKGSDAGTSLKTMLMRLMAPTKESAEALKSIGLGVESFRGADGRILPLVKIIGTLQAALANVDQVARDDIFREVFGQDAIRAAAILTQTGVDGFQAMRDSMSGALSVGEKFAGLQSGLSGSARTLFASMERLAITISDAVAPSVMQAAGTLNGFAVGLQAIVAQNQTLISSLGKVAVGVVAVGAAFTGVGAAIQAVAFGFSGLIKAAALLVVPLVSVVSAAVSLAVSFGTALASVVAYAATSIASATATAVAWGLANVPLYATLGILVAIGGLAAGVFLGLISGAQDAAAAVGGVLRPAVQEAGNALAEMKQIGVETFGAIFEAINGGDLAGAMQIAMAGLKAAFTVGSNSFLNAVDEWGVNLVNAFDFYISQIPFLRFLGKDSYQFSVFGDSTEGGTADQRADERFAQMYERRDARKAAGEAAVAGLTDAVSGVQANARSSRESKARNEQFAQLLKDIEAATTLDQLRDAYGEFDALSSNGRLTSTQSATLEAALEDAQERITQESGAAGGAAAAAAGPAPGDAAAGAGAAGADAAQSRGDSAGTFSAMAAGAMGVGSSIPQKQLDALQKIEKNTRENADGGVVQE